MFTLVSVFNRVMTVSVALVALVSVSACATSAPQTKASAPVVRVAYEPSDDFATTLCRKMELEIASTKQQANALAAAGSDMQARLLQGQAEQLRAKSDAKGCADS